MNYFITRGEQQYGPYSLAELQRYVQQGNIALTDQARSEGMTDWVPVSQIIGNVSVPQPGPYGAPAGPYGAAPGGYGAFPGQSPGQNPNPYGAPATPYGAPGVQGAPQEAPMGVIYPPPALHWGLVLLFTIFTCGIFAWIWCIVQAVWVRKIRPQNTGLFYYITALVVNYGGSFALIFLLLANSEIRVMMQFIRFILTLVVCAIYIVGSFNIKAALEDYYNKEEPIGLQLSGGMTFFFAVFYFQYHLSRIREMKNLQMQPGGGGYPGQYYGR